MNRGLADVWARADEHRSRIGVSGLEFTQEQIKSDIAEGRT